MSDTTTRVSASTGASTKAGNAETTRRMRLPCAHADTCVNPVKFRVVERDPASRKVLQHFACTVHLARVIKGLLEDVNDPLTALDGIGERTVAVRRHGQFITVPVEQPDGAS